MPLITIKPAKAGSVLRDPADGFSQVPDTGKTVKDSVYWRRRIRFGDAVLLAPPSAPANLKASARDSKAELSWSAPDEAPASYDVYRGLASGAETLLGTSKETSYTDETAADGTLYYYEVSAVNVCGESARSNEASAEPKAGS